MNDTYFGNRIERSPLGNMGLQLLEAQEKLVSQEYEVENLRIKAAMYKAYFFRNSILAEKLEKQSEENRDALIGEFDGFLYASWRANAVYRTLEDMCYEGLLTEKEYRECKVWNKGFIGKDKRMKVKELLENFKGDNHIKIYDMHSFDTHRFNNANEAIRQFGYYTVREWDVVDNILKVTIRTQF